MRIRLWIFVFLLTGSMLGTEQAEAARKRPPVISATPAKVTAFFLPEVTAAAIGPGANPACPDGRLILASGVDLRRLALDGTDLGGLDLRTTIGETGADPIYDNHMLSLPDGSVIHTVEGITWSDDDVPDPKPTWWEQSIEYPAKGILPGRAGARAAIWVFRSTSCGDTWTLAGKVDAATLQVEDPGNGLPAGPQCGTLRPQEANRVKVSDGGGWDGHYLAVDPHSKRLVISTPCVFGTGLNSSAAFQILVVSDDLGKTWKSTISLPQNFWRAPVTPAIGGKWAYVWSDDKSIRLAIDDPVNGTFSKSIEVAPLTSLEGSPKDTFVMNPSSQATLDVAVNPFPVGAFTSSSGVTLKPSMRNLVQVSSASWDSTTKALTYRIHNIDSRGGAPRLVSTIRSSVSGESVLFGTFLQGHRASLFYWFEEVGPAKYRVRYQAYFRGKALLLSQFARQVPGTIRNADGSNHEFTAQDGKFHGDYMKGSHILESDGVERFILVWTENGFPAHAEVKISNLPRDDEDLPKRP